MLERNMKRGRIWSREARRTGERQPWREKV